MKPSQNRQEGHFDGLESTIPTKPIHNPCVKNIGNTRSLRRAVDAFCAHCMGCTEEHREPGFIDDVRHCTSSSCPLWHFRPYQPKQGISQGGGAVIDISRAAQVPYSVAAQSVLSAASMVAQKECNVIVDGRCSPCSIFAIAIADSGDRKSTADKMATKPLHDYQRDEYRKWKQEVLLS